MSINFTGSDHVPLSEDEDISTLDNHVLNLQEDLGKDPHRNQSTMQQLKDTLQQKEHELHEIAFNDVKRREFLFKYLHWKNLLTCCISITALIGLLVALFAGLIFMQTRGFKINAGTFVLIDANNKVRLFDSYFNRFQSVVDSVNDAKSSIGGYVSHGSYYVFWKNRWAEHAAAKTESFDGDHGSFSHDIFGYGLDYDADQWMVFGEKCGNDDQHCIKFQDGNFITIPSADLTNNINYARLTKNGNYVYLFIVGEEWEQQLYQVNTQDKSILPVDISDFHVVNFDADIYSDASNHTFVATAAKKPESEDEEEVTKLYTVIVNNQESHWTALSKAIEIGELDEALCFHSFYTYDEINQGKTKKKFVRMNTLVTKDRRLYSLNALNGEVFADSTIQKSIVSVGLNTRLK